MGNVSFNSFEKKIIININILQTINVSLVPQIKCYLGIKNILL